MPSARSSCARSRRRCSGPFESRGAGKLPKSNFNIGLSALGHHGQLGIVSTGATGYVTLDGNAYRLPAGDVPEARVELLVRRVGRRHPVEAGDRSAALADQPNDRRHRDDRWRRDDPHPRGDRRRGAAGRSEHLPRQGVELDQGDPRHDLGRDASEDRRRGQEPDRRRLDRERRQDAAQADRSTSASRSAARSRRCSAASTSAGFGLTLRYVGPQPAADDLGAGQPAVVQRL